MKKVSTRKTSVVWVNENSELKILPVLQSIENEDEQYFWSHPEELLFVHDDARVERDGNNCILDLEDQRIVIECQKVFRFSGDIIEAVTNSLVSNDYYTQRIQPIDVDVRVFIADPYTNPEEMSQFFDIAFVYSDEYSDECPACKMHKHQAEQILAFLDEAVFIPKDTNVETTNFLQKNLKRAIFIGNTSKAAILQWFVDTFHVTFERAKIKSVILCDIETDDQYIMPVIPTE